jgi:glycerol-3-phosphate dehydrogenase
VLSAIPAQFTYGAIKEYAELIPPGVPVATISKGICSSKTTRDGTPDPTYLMTMDEVLELALGKGRNPIVALAGPSFAKQICELEPTAVTVASKDEAVARDVALVFSSCASPRVIALRDRRAAGLMMRAAHARLPRCALCCRPLFKLYYTTDIVGAEISGALKNVVAIACGMCVGCPVFNVPAASFDKLGAAQAKIRELVASGGLDAAAADELLTMVDPALVISASIAEESAKKKGGPGLKLGPNASNLLLTLLWEDVRKICVAKGGRTETLISLSGLGDLMLTCFGGESRNAKFGGILGGTSLAGTEEADASELTPTVQFVLDNPQIYPVSEGFYTSRALVDVAAELQVDIPVLSKMCDVLAGVIDPKDLIATVMTEPVGPEFDPDHSDTGAVVPARKLHLPPTVGA